MKRRAAFTLIELLVVVAIIIALLAILLPSMNRAMDVTLRTVCGSNQHQLHTAFIAYAGDHQGTLPPIAPALGSHMLWCWDVPVADKLRHDYLGGSWEVLFDPMDKASEVRYLYEPPTSTGSGAGNFRITGYAAMSHPWLTPAGSGGNFNTYGEDFAVLRITDVSSKVLIADPLYHTPPQDTGSVWAWRWNIPNYGFHPGTPGGEDGSNAAGGNRASLDGSVRWVDLVDMELRVFQVLFGQNRAYWW